MRAKAYLSQIVWTPPPPAAGKDRALNILALDTCVEACSVAVWADGRTLAALSEPMVRGHQERLAPMAAEALAEAGLAFADARPDRGHRRARLLHRPARGPGLRQGAGAGAGRPLVGIGTLEALAAPARGAGLVAA